MLKTQFNILLSLTILCTVSSVAQEQAQKLEWELGGGLAVFDVPLYVGSSQTRQYLLPIPYVKLKSRYFEIDDGIRGFFFTSPNIRLDISADLGVPVNSDDSGVRQGMPDLDAVLQFGPSLEITLSGNRRGENELRLEFPVRAAIATDIKSIENKQSLIAILVTIFFVFCFLFAIGWSFWRTFKIDNVLKKVVNSLLGQFISG